MAISIFSNSGKEHYGIKHYVVDTEAEAILLPRSDHPGSTAFVVENSSTYMLNASYQWVKVFFNNGTGSSGSVDPNETTIWDGGSGA